MGNKLLKLSMFDKHRVQLGFGAQKDLKEVTKDESNWINEELFFLDDTEFESWLALQPSSTFERSGSPLECGSAHDSARRRTGSPDKF